jgi:hypothetical protein
MFCPVLAAIGPRNLIERKDSSPTSMKVQSKTLCHNNEPQQAKQGIYVGLPRHSSGWMVYFPGDNRIVVSQDVYFDK